MTEPAVPDSLPQAVVSDEALRKAQLYVEEEEGAANRLGGWLAAFVTVFAVGMSAFHLYSAYAIVPTQTLRPLHVAMVRSERSENAI